MIKKIKANFISFPIYTDFYDHGIFYGKNGNMKNLVEILKNINLKNDIMYKLANQHNWLAR